MLGQFSLSATNVSKFYVNLDIPKAKELIERSVTLISRHFFLYMANKKIYVVHYCKLFAPLSLYRSEIKEGQIGLILSQTLVASSKNVEMMLNSKNLKKIIAIEWDLDNKICTPFIWITKEYIANDGYDNMLYWCLLYLTMLGLICKNKYA